MVDISNLTIEELIGLHEAVVLKLVEDYDFFNIMRMSNSWVKSVETSIGCGRTIPFTELYKDHVELYNQTKLAVEEQIEHLKKFPQLGGLLGMVVERDTGIMQDASSSYINKKLYSNENI